MRLWKGYAVATWVLSLAPGVLTLADVTLPGIIGENMVLQQGTNVCMWGWAAPGEKVSVTLAEETKTTAANDKGEWSVSLSPLDAGGPYRMTIAGNNSIAFTNVLVGEVWLCSGQSNMELPVSSAKDSHREIAAADYPRIRLFQVGRSIAIEPRANCSGSWNICSPYTVRGFSAVGYFFGRDLHLKLGVPIGMINSSWGGTPAAAWTPGIELESQPDLKRFRDLSLRGLAQYAEALYRVAPQLRDWFQACDSAKAAGKPIPSHAIPALPEDPRSFPSYASGLYNAMIAPLAPFAIAGAIWYQGEADAGRAYTYRTLLPSLIRGWRRTWDRGDFPFLIVQLPNFRQVQPQPTESEWAELREAQLLTLSVPKTGIAVTIDLGEATDIHPTNKQDVAARLALLAEGAIYGLNVVYSGAVYESMTVEGNKVRLRFKHVGSGLVARGGEPLKGFAIAGDDRKFVWAEASIDGDTVVVSSREVPRPVAVRYAWADNPVCNLFNKDGLPASPFRTDDWPGITFGRR